ncbi:uncharacterized protein LOC111115523 [Crassostrea virginica]
MILHICLTFIFFVFVSESRVVSPHQNCTSNVCYFDFVIDYKFTMMWYNYTNLREPQYNPIVTRDGILQRRISNPQCQEEFIPITKEELKESVSTGDGNYKLVYAINGQIPGPNVVVFEDQIVSITVHNALEIEGVTIHWHGMIQRGTPWMDGVSMISQCPILPGQTFEYRFVAYPAGTHWYHGHLSSLLSDGIMGALIVLPRIRPPIFMTSDPLPDIEGEFSVLVFEWMKTTAQEKFQAIRGGFGGLNDYDGQCFPLTYKPDGSASLLQLYIGLVNGRGQRYINGDPASPEIPYLPLETFTVKQNRYYRFRTINSGFQSPFEISVDDHMLIVVAFDGKDVEPYKTDIVVISPGESVDFIIFTNRPRDNYRINYFITTFLDANGDILRNRGRTYAVLNYEGVDEYSVPTIRQRDCTPSVPCTVVNQLYSRYPAGINIISIPLTHLRSTQWSIKKLPVPIVKPGQRKQLFFLNFNINPGRGANINALQFVKPTSALQTYPGPGVTVPCDPETCTDVLCKCTHTVKLDLGNVIEMVIFSFGNIKVVHPVHLHGHHFHVLKIGYPPIDPQTGNSTGPTPDIRCLNEQCSRATWSDPSWINGNIPDLNLIDPPIKDTVNVPANGYVIIRFKADNPGYWFLHCHFANHQFQGMSLVMQEGEIREMPPTPPNFPTCNSFQFDHNQFLMSLRKQERMLSSKGIPRSSTSGVSYVKPANVAKTCHVFPWTCKKPMYG